MLVPFGVAARFRLDGGGGAAFDTNILVGFIVGRKVRVVVEKGVVRKEKGVIQGEEKNLYFVVYVDKY